MNLKVDFLLIITLFIPFIYAQLYDGWSKFPVSPKIKFRVAPDVPDVLDDQSTTEKSIIEINHRIDGIEPKLSAIQKSLKAILKLQGIMEDKLKIEKSCDTMDTNIDHKLEIMKNDLINEMSKKHRERTRYFNAQLEQVQKGLSRILGVEFKDAEQVRDRLRTEVDFINNQLQNITKQIATCGNKPQQSVKKKSRPALPTVSKIPKNCRDVLQEGVEDSGIYIIKPAAAPEPFTALCDMETQGGGWTYFMRRFDGSQDFNLNWTDYKRGFGNVQGEFWLGLEHLYELTGSEPFELLFVLTDWEGKTVHANFKKFSIGDESERYVIKVLEGYSGDAGSSFFFHRNKKFSTLDKQDEHGHCIKTNIGPWWYGPGCFVVKLTGEYSQPGKGLYAKGIHYNVFHDYDYSLKEVAMLVRP